MKTKQTFTLNVVTFDLEGPEEFLGVLKRAVDEKVAPFMAPKKRRGRKPKEESNSEKEMPKKMMPLPAAKKKAKKQAKKQRKEDFE